MGTEVVDRWGTWEELLLGGAVLRHGTHDWNVVAAELRARAVCPYTFTPEVLLIKLNKSDLFFFLFFLNGIFLMITYHLHFIFTLNFEFP